MGDDSGTDVGGGCTWEGGDRGRYGCTWEIIWEESITRVKEEKPFVVWCLYVGVKQWCGGCV